jgi:hypothetical protein
MASLSFSTSMPTIRDRKVEIVLPGLLLEPLESNQWEEL